MDRIGNREVMRTAEVVSCTRNQTWDQDLRWADFGNRVNRTGPADCIIPGVSNGEDGCRKSKLLTDREWLWIPNDERT